MATQSAIQAENGFWDRAALTLSGLCIAHCLAAMALLATLSSFGILLMAPIFHEIGMVLAIILGVIALGRGMISHGRMPPALIGGMGLGLMALALTMPHGTEEVAMNVAGVLILAIAHIWNLRASRRCAA